MSDTLRVQGEPQDFLLYRSSDGHVHVQYRLEYETIWLTQQQISELFCTTPQNITMHLTKINERSTAS